MSKQRPEMTYRPSEPVRQRIGWIKAKMQEQDQKFVLNDAIEEAMIAWLEKKEKTYGSRPAATGPLERRKAG